MKITDIKSETNHANTIGMALRQPLFRAATLCGRITLNSPFDSRAKVVASYVAAFFIALLTFAPCSILWFVGKGICLIGHPSLNPEGLSLAPPEETPPSPQEPQDLNTLYTTFVNQIPPEKRSTFEQACKIIQAGEEHQFLPPNQSSRELFLNEITLYLSNVLVLLQNPDTPAAKREEALTLLADGFSVCHTTWLEQTKRAYRLLSGQEEAGEILLLRHLQQDKDDLILQFTQQRMNLQWHALNYVRSLLSTVLGLNRDYHFDAYRGHQDSIFGPRICLWLFMQVYADTNRLITAIQTRINAADYEGKYAVLLRDAIEQADRTIKDSGQYVLDNYYEANTTTLNRKGTIALLSLIGILH